MVIRRSAFTSEMSACTANFSTVLLPFSTAVNSSRSIAANMLADSMNARLIFCSRTVSTLGFAFSVMVIFPSFMLEYFRTSVSVNKCLSRRICETQNGYWRNSIAEILIHSKIAVLNFAYDQRTKKSIMAGTALASSQNLGRCAPD